VEEVDQVLRALQPFDIAGHHDAIPAGVKRIGQRYPVALTIDPRDDPPEVGCVTDIPILISGASLAPRHGNDGSHAVENRMIACQSSATPSGQPGAAPHRLQHQPQSCRCDPSAPSAFRFTWLDLGQTPGCWRGQSIEPAGPGTDQANERSH
jgi:hypothetical protein